MRSAAFVLALVGAGQVFASQGPAIPKEDPKAIIDRLRSKRFPEADDRLEARDAGAGAQMVQEKIIEDLDKLLDENDNAGSDARKNAGRSRPKDAGRNPGTKKDREQPAIGDRVGKSGKRGEGMGADRKDPVKPPTVSDLRRDIWPPMPDRNRQEMDAYGKDKPLPKYEQLLGEYYRTIAEQNKRRDSE
jgi:hypothetical protein